MPCKVASLVSIITPAYYAAEHLPKAIASVVVQTFAYWEMIIAYNGSTAAMTAFMDEVDDERIRVIHQPNGGVSAARNTALDAAQGRYITFLDADDRLPPYALAVRTRFFDDQPQGSQRPQINRLSKTQLRLCPHSGLGIQGLEVR